MVLVFDWLMDLLNTEDRVQEVWQWCSEAYIQHGIKLSLPKNTDPQKTYQWRYARSLAKKFEQWDFDEQTSRRFIAVALKHIKNSRSNKGLAIFHQNNLLDAIYKELQKEISTNRDSLGSLEASHQWVIGHVGNNMVRSLLCRSDLDSFTNIVRWHQASKLSDLYLSLSYSCFKALAILARSKDRSDLDERRLLPSAARLYLLRSEFVNDVSRMKKAQEILQSDWREQCL